MRAFVVRNPPLLAAIAGLLAPASLAPAVLVHASHLVVDGLLPLGFFAVGVFLASERGQTGRRVHTRLGPEVALAVAVRLTVTPAVLVAASLLVLRLPSAYILEAAMPTGINALVVGVAFGLDQHLIARIIVAGTVTVLVSALVVASGVFGHP